MGGASGGGDALAAVPESEFLLLTDADIEHDSGNVRRLVAAGRDKRLDLVSLMVRLRCETLWERLLVPPFIFFFQKLYPFAWVNEAIGRRRRRPAAACSIRTAALQATGGIAAIRGHLIDDCAMAARIKQHGGAIWLGLSR